MTQVRLERIIRQTSSDFESSGGMARFVFGGLPMACICDPGHDRMRIVAPILETSQLTGEQREALLEANFHSGELVFGQPGSR